MQVNDRDAAFPLLKHTFITEENLFFFSFAPLSLHVNYLISLNVTTYWLFMHFNFFRSWINKYFWGFWDDPLKNTCDKQNLELINCPSGLCGPPGQSFRARVLPSNTVCDSNNKTRANFKKKMKAKQAMTQTEIKTACWLVLLKRRKHAAFVSSICLCLQETTGICLHEPRSGTCYKCFKLSPGTIWSCFQ